MKRPKFWKKAKPKKPPYTFLVVRREEWPEDPSLSNVRSMLLSIMRKKSPSQFFPDCWAFSVPRVPGTKIFRVSKQRRSLVFSVCFLVKKDGSLKFPESRNRTFSLK